jgi:cold shock CspA family protein
MRTPLEITYRGVEKTDYLDELIREKAKKLEKFSDQIISGRVVVEKPQESQQRGSPYGVMIYLTIPPGHEIVAKREPGEGEMHEKVDTVIRDAFQAASRQLKEMNEKRRGQVKSHPEQEVAAVVVRLFPEQDYGFIKTPDGRDVYFHRNAVLNNDFDRLEVGTGVRYVESLGDKGRQASAVSIVDKPGRRPAESDAEATEKPEGWR